MKNSDINKMINLIRLTYQGAYQTANNEQEIALVTLWQDLFSDYEDEVIMRAFKNVLKGSKFVPKPADIIEEADKILEASGESDLGQWQQLVESLYEVKNYAFMLKYDFVEKNGLTQGDNALNKIKDIFNNLNEQLKEYVISPENLICLSKYTDEQLSIEKSRFIKAYPTIKSRLKYKKQMALLGGNVFKQIGEQQ